MSIANYRYTKDDHKENNKLVYVLILIMFSLLALIWVMWLSSANNLSKFSANNFHVTKNEKFENIEMKNVQAGCIQFARA